MRHPHVVTSPVPVTLTGGRPAAPGELVDADPVGDRLLIAAGALTARPSSRRRRRRRKQADEAPSAPVHTPIQEDA